MNSQLCEQCESRSNISLESVARLVHPVQSLRVSCRLVKCVDDIQIWPLEPWAISESIYQGLINIEPLIGSLHSHIARGEVSKRIARARTLRKLIKHPLEVSDSFRVF